MPLRQYSSRLHDADHGYLFIKLYRESFIKVSFDLIFEGPYTLPLHGVAHRKTSLSMQPKDARQAKRLLLIQVILTLVLSILGLSFGMLFSVSVLVGGGVCTFANSLLAYVMFGHYRASEPGQLVTRFYVAEILKLAVILALLSAAFLLIDGVSLPAILSAYFVVQVLPFLMASQWDVADTNLRK